MNDKMDLTEPVHLDDHRNRRRTKTEPVLVLDPVDPMTSARAFIDADGYQTDISDLKYRRPNT